MVSIRSAEWLRHESEPQPVVADERLGVGDQLTVSLVDYKHLVCQVDPERLSSRLLENQVVGQSDDLGEQGRRVSRQMSMRH
jgi:hypothetical protein